MTSTTPRLVLLKSGAPADPELLRQLEAAFEIVEVDDIAAARKLLQDHAGLVVCPPDCLADDSGDLPPRGAAAMLQQFGEGIGMVNADTPDGTLAWANRRLKRQPREVQEQFVLHCRDAVRLFNAATPEVDGAGRAATATYQFTIGQASYELVVAPALARTSDSAPVTAAVGVLWDITESQKLQAKLDAIDAAGSELMKIEATKLASMNMAQRLKWLEEKIVRYVHELLNFDNFEIRLLDKQTGQLELVIAVGLAPLKIGEVIYARREGNGISGYVAATGESYLCPDVRRDPLYREGLDNARSSLTVPLYLHDQVIGVFNAESYTVNVFDENDRRFAEIFGRYVAIAMNILDLMVVERYTTNSQVADNVLREIGDPLADITKRTETLAKESTLPPALQENLEQILNAATRIRERIEACTRGPRTIFGAEQELSKHEIDPLMQGKRVLVADDEPTIRDTICSILTQKGCIVTVCANGGDTIEALERSRAANTPYDLVVSDIKMPDRNGYEVFRAAKSVRNETPVILMTGFGYDPHHSIVRSSQEGLDLFLFKPFKASQLLEAITKSLSS